jgi:solute carrier family 35, member C2
MVKSSSLIFVLLFAFLFRLEVFSLRLIGVITLIFGGVLLMVATQTHFVLGGFILVLSGSAIGGLRWSLTQLLLKDRRLGLDNPVATIFWLAPVMGAFLMIISIILDRPSELISSRFFDSVGSALKTCFFLTAPGILAFFMILSEFTYVLRRPRLPLDLSHFRSF